MEKDMNEDEIRKLQRELNAVNDKLNSILTLLKGHELDTEATGLVHKINLTEVRLMTLEKAKDRITYFAIGATVPATWGIIDLVREIANVVR